MPTEFACPGCGSTVLIPNRAAQLIQDWNDEYVGCDNTDEHDDGEPLVMWLEEDDA